MGTNFLKIEGGSIAYDDSGSGPLVICVPSMGDLRGEYRFLAPRLASAGYRVVSMDVRGHGETSVNWPDYSVAAIGSDILALARSLDAGPAAVIGTSMAAGAGVWAAAELPRSVAGLLLIGPFVRGGGDWQGKLLFSILMSRPWGPATWQRYYASLYPTRKPDDFSQYSQALRANLQESGRLEALRQMLFASKAASEIRLPQVKSPALVLMGSKDRDFKVPESEAQWVAQSLRASYTMVQDAGHYPHAEMPEVVTPLALSFLQTLRWVKENPHDA